jgi:signal transduction histidine kinase
MKQLFFNLIGNSIKYRNPLRDQLTVQIHADTVDGDASSNADLQQGISYCHLSVSDNGMGFDQQHTKHIFDIFQRLHTRAEYDGTGIGLAIVKKIVDNHNGTIQVSSEVNKGTHFDIYLPMNAVVNSNLNYLSSLN